ncbi:MAG: hypothetical protein ACLFOY_18105 [Desulfatibacillaceae bacterium]
MNGVTVRMAGGLANGRMALLLLAAYAVSQGGIYLVLQDISHDVLKLQTTFSPEVFAGILESWGEAGRARYVAHFFLDFFHPLIYGAFLAVAGTWAAAPFFRESSRLRRTFVVLPFVAGFCDLMENVLHLHMLGHWREVSGSVLGTSAVFACVKWILAGVCVVYVVGLLAARGLWGKNVS